MAPGITIRVVRIRSRDVRTAGEPPTWPVGLRALTAAPVLDEAVELAMAEPIDAVAYASTSSAYAIGFDDEVAMLARLSRRTEIPVWGPVPRLCGRCGCSTLGG
jgi:maleate isomerase